MGTAIFYIFMHIPKYFHVYLYLYLTYSDIILHIYYYFLHVEHYNYYYLPRVLPASGTTCLGPTHTFLLSNYLDQWEVSILITCSILSNQRARNVPQNEGHLINVPHVPHMRDR